MMNGTWIDGGGWFFGVLIAAGVVLLIILLVRLLGGGLSRGTGGGQGTQAPSSGRRLLDERYARGDLTTEEYQERIRVLGGGS